MCQYCSYTFHDGWTQLLQYDEVYQRTVGSSSDGRYGFHESWADLREQVGIE